MKNDPRRDFHFSSLSAVNYIEAKMYAPNAEHLPRWERRQPILSRFSMKGRQKWRPKDRKHLTIMKRLQKEKVKIK
jgi:hypothetical protein